MMAQLASKIWNVFSPFLTITIAVAIWEGFKFFYPDIKRFLQSRVEAKNNFYDHLDPILKASSELYGKLESLAKEDFSTFINPVHSNSQDPEGNRVYVYFLFCQFWAQLESFRSAGQYISLSDLDKGKELLRFVETFESRKFRIVDRSIQRILGGNLINSKEKRFPVMTLNEFVVELKNENSALVTWVSHLDRIFKQVDDKEIRQTILVYGVIVAALIDHFDPEYKSVRRRAIYTNKLSVKSRKKIQNTLLKHYLEFLKRPEKYYSQ